MTPERYQALLRWLEARISLRPLIWCGRHSMFLMATHLPWQIAPELVMLGKRFYLAQTPTAPYFLMMPASHNRKITSMVLPPGLREAMRHIST